VDGLIIRPAHREDLHRIAELISGDPGQEALGLVGNRRLARRLGMAWIISSGSTQGWKQSTIAELSGEAVGVIQAGGGLSEFNIGLSDVWLALRILGPLRSIAQIPRLNARARVQPKRPQGAYHIAELDVDPAHRNKGIGGALLDWAEAQAREQGFKQMSLTTTTNNPARRLYERHGFYIAETLTDDAYRRYTGIDGRHLMLKDLA
jgi:ribosomal protein S18 acetylase RimI-like enzyme